VVQVGQVVVVVVPVDRVVQVVRVVLEAQVAAWQGRLADL
jgi:hypothetical protein